MYTLWKIIRGILVLFGVLFLVEVIFLAWFWLADPLELKQFLAASDSAMIEDNPGQTNSNVNSSPPVQDKNPLLTDQQEKTLETLGVDPATLPTEITPEMQACLIEKVGPQRAQEIIGGAVPTAIDLIKARPCL